MIQNLSIAKLQVLAGEIQRFFPTSHIAIAGGCVRDLLSNREVKDIDVFIQLGSTDESERANEHYNGCDLLGKWLHCNPVYEGDLLDLTNSKGYSYGAFALVDYPTGWRGHPVQLVFIDEHPVDNVTRHFDFGLSQCWVTPNQLRMTKAYWFDYFNQRITYLPSAAPNEQRRLSSKHRAERLKAKYKGWRFDRLWLLDDVVLPAASTVPLVTCKKPFRASVSYSGRSSA